MVASVTGTQTNESVRPKETLLRGTAQLVAGDDSISVTIPPSVQAPIGKQLCVEWGAELSKEEKSVLRGTAQLDSGDDTLGIPIPPEIQAPSGKELSVTWTVVLKRVS